MTDSRPKELLRVEELINEAKFEEALEIIEDFEKISDLTPKDQLSALLLKGRIYASNEQFKDAVKVGRRAYRLAQKHEKVLESIEAMIFKSHAVFLGEFDKALELILEAEKKINLLTDESSSNIQRQKARILRQKSWVYYFKGDLDSALESAEQSLSLQEKIGNKLEIAYNFVLIGYIYHNLLEFDAALDYAMKSLDLMEELDFHCGIATSTHLVGKIYHAKGDFNQALIYGKKSFSISDIGNQTKLANLTLLGAINYQKGDIDKSLKYHNQAIVLAEELNRQDQLATNLFHLGYVSRMKGEYDRAIELNESSLTIAENINYPYVICMSLVVLILLYLDKGSREQAQQYLVRLKKLSDQTQQKFITQMYLLSKAMMLKMSGRTSNRSEAEVLLRKIVEEDAFFSPEPQFHALINLCDLYLEDLSLSNNLEILEDINPVITQLLNLAEKVHSYLYLAETKLLQAKLALIQINLPKAKQLLVEAQRIAELHGLDLLAMKISSEHDTLLEQLDLWDSLKKRNASISERIKLVSLDETIERMLRKRAIEPPELVDEQSILLLIIAEGGIPAFSNRFAEEWSIEDGFISNFLTAFNTFSEEVFSKGLDRAKFGEYMLVMDSVGSFSVCYLFKGQSYLAKQKLIQFAHRVQNTASIWQVFKSFHKTHQPIVLSENPPLKSLITEIFIKKSPEISTPI